MCILSIKVRFMGVRRELFFICKIKKETYTSLNFLFLKKNSMEALKVDIDSRLSKEYLTHPRAIYSPCRLCMLLVSEP